MSLLPNSSHSVSLQVIVSALKNIYSVISTCVNWVSFWYCILPKMHYSHDLSYRGHWRQG